jgi:hypothetical protein
MARRRRRGTAGRSTGSLGTSGNAAAERARNQAGFIDTYNRANPGAQYGTPQFGQSQAVAPPPPDWQQQAYEASQARGVQYADAQATYDRGRVQRDFGYGANGQVDPSNPYSRAALLERNFSQQQAGDTNSFASQGQLYSGALQNQKNQTTFGYLQGNNALRNEYADANANVALGQLGAYSQAGGAVSEEKIRALLRALGQG